MNKRVPTDVQKSLFETEGDLADMFFHERHENWRDSFFELDKTGENVLRFNFSVSDVGLAAEQLFSTIR